MDGGGVRLDAGAGAVAGAAAGGQAAGAAVGVADGRAARRRAADPAPAGTAGAAAGPGGRGPRLAAAAREARAGGRGGAGRAARAAAHAAGRPGGGAHGRAGGGAGGGRARRRAPAVRRHRVGQDRGLPAGGGPRARARAGRDRAGAGDRADAADRRALPGALRRHRRAAALGAGRGRALRRVAAAALGRGADRGRAALGGVRSRRAAGARRGRRGARQLLQARGRPALRRAARGGLGARERAGAALLVGSATPRPETWQALPRLELRERADGRPLPPVRVLDMRGSSHPLHPDTRRALGEAHKAIVLLNRRGWSNFLTCRSCGKVWECPQCDVALVLHRSQNAIACHHCGHRERVPDRCDACGSLSVARYGAGTERVEAELSEASTCRCSGSTPTRRGRRTRCRACSRASTPRRRGCCWARRWWPRATTSPT